MGRPTCAALLLAIFPGAATAEVMDKLPSVDEVWIVTILFAGCAAALGWANRWAAFAPLALAAILYIVFIDEFFLDPTMASSIRTEAGRIYFVSVYAGLPIVALAAVVGFWMGLRRNRGKRGPDS